MGETLADIARHEKAHRPPRLVGKHMGDGGQHRSRIEVRNLDFFYGATQALEQVCLNLPEHQVTGLIGPSGCGKSTLLRAALWTEVKDRLRCPASALSVGQQQRLCIARMLSTRPEVVLMDEPTLALDPLSMAKVEDLIDELNQMVTIVLVTHNLQQAARCVDRMAFFYLGEMIRPGWRSRCFLRRRWRPGRTKRDSGTPDVARGPRRARGDRVHASAAGTTAKIECVGD